jgi:hypothetical protein
MKALFIGSEIFMNHCILRARYPGHYSDQVMAWMTLRKLCLISGRVRRCCESFRPNVGPIQPPTHWVAGIP